MGSQGHVRGSKGDSRGPRGSSRGLREFHEISSGSQGCFRSLSGGTTRVREGLMTIKRPSHMKL